MHSPARLTLAGLLALSFVPGCNKGDPKTAKYWVDKVKEDKGEGTKKADLDKLAGVLKASKEPGAAAQVAELLKDQPGDVPMKAAEILGELGDKAAVPALSAAVDVSRGAGADKSTQSINHLNKAIAEALGKLGDASGATALIQLLRCKDLYAQMAAIQALGTIKAQAGVDPLIAIATDMTGETLPPKLAIVALGNIGDPKAIPALHKMLFKERKDRGVSFFAEASFAMYQIGKASSDVLLADLENKDEDFKKWIKENDVLPGAVFAKATQILSDLAEPRAVPYWEKLLSYKDTDAMIEAAVRVQAADALGRTHAVKAAKALAELVEDSSLESRTRALSFLGDKATALPPLWKLSKLAHTSTRDLCFKAICMLGGPDELKQFDEALKNEDKLERVECKEQGIEDADCTKEVTTNSARFNTYRPALASKCSGGTDTACWTGLLQDPSGIVRQRAALELGRSGKKEAFDALLAVVQKPLAGATKDELIDSDTARFFAIVGINWLLDAGYKPADAQGIVAKLEAQVDVEKTKDATRRSAEDVKRLAVKLGRAG
jgi:HEAT repeat protein